MTFSSHLPLNPSKVSLVHVNDPLFVNLMPLSLGDLIAGGLAAVRLSAAISMLPVLVCLPWRTRIGIAAVLGVALGSAQSLPVATWSWASILSELFTGVSLGIGLRVTLSALQSAGSWIDEQATTGLAAEPILSEADESTSGAAQVLTWIGAWLILTSGTWGADLSVIQHAIDSLRAIPPGTVVTPEQIPAWCVGLLRSWSHLAVGVALPVCLVAGLIQAGLTMIGRGLGIGLGLAMTPLRAGLTCLLLVIVLPWQAERMDRHLTDPPSVIGHSVIDTGAHP